MVQQKCPGDFVANSLEFQWNFSLIQCLWQFAKRSISIMANWKGEIVAGGLKPMRAPYAGDTCQGRSEPITGVWGRGPGTEPWSGPNPLKLKGFQHWNVQKKRHFGLFWEFWELKKTTINLNWLSVWWRVPQTPVLWVPIQHFGGFSRPRLRPCLHWKSNHTMKWLADSDWQISKTNIYFLIITKTTESGQVL